MGNNCLGGGGALPYLCWPIRWQNSAGDYGRKLEGLTLGLFLVADRVLDASCVVLLVHCRLDICVLFNFEHLGVVGPSHNHIERNEAAGDGKLPTTPAACSPNSLAGTLGP